MKYVRVMGAIAVVAAVVVLGASLLPFGEAPPSADEPSYEALRTLLEEGEGKGLDQGVVDFFQVHSPLPTAWIWIDVQDGVGVEHWAKHPSFLPIDPEDPETAGEYVYVENYVPADLGAFLDWIVLRSSHVNSPTELTVDVIVVGE